MQPWPNQARLHVREFLFPSRNEFSLDGTTAAIGAYENNSNGGGLVHGYPPSSKSWIQLGDNNLLGGRGGDKFGYSYRIAMDSVGERIAVSTAQAKKLKGYVKVFVFDLDQKGNVWNQVGDTVWKRLHRK